jgi:hypothetical protein
VHPRPKRPRTCEAAAKAAEQFLAAAGERPRPKEWTLLISAWGAAQRPDQALRCLGQAEAELARQSQLPRPQPPQTEAQGEGVQEGRDEIEARRVDYSRMRPKPVYGAAVGALCACGDVDGAAKLLQVLSHAPNPLI